MRLSFLNVFSPALARSANSALDGRSNSISPLSSDANNSCSSRSFIFALDFSFVLLGQFPAGKCCFEEIDISIFHIGYGVDVSVYGHQKDSLSWIPFLIPMPGNCPYLSCQEHGDLFKRYTTLLFYLFIFFRIPIKLHGLIVCLSGIPSMLNISQRASQSAPNIEIRINASDFRFISGQSTVTCGYCRPQRSDYGYSR